MITLELSSYCTGKPHRSLYNTQWISDWLFNTRSRVLQADWLISANIEMASFIIDMPYGSCNVAGVYNFNVLSYFFSLTVKRIEFDDVSFIMTVLWLCLCM